MSSLKWKKRFTYFVIGLFYFMGGVEYAVILPTIWLYLKTEFHAEEYTLGLLLSGYSFAVILSGPLLGRWSDTSRKPKLIMMLGVLFEVAGNIMYFMGISVWFLLASRLVAGIGGGVEAVLMAEVTRNSEEEHRTGIISLLVAIRQTGLLVGPGLNLFLREMDFVVGKFHVNKYNVPGAFMACVWTLQILLILVLYTDLHKLKPSSQTKTRLIETQDHIASHSNHYHGNTVRVDYDEDIYKQIGSGGSDKNSINSGHEHDHTIATNQDPDDLMETAEDFMVNGHNQEAVRKSSLQTSNSFTQDAAGSYSHPLYAADGNNADTAETGPVTIETDYGTFDNNLTLFGEEKMNRKGSEGSQDYIQSTEGILDDYLKGRSKLKFLYHEYVREEIVTVIAIQFNSFFNQLALETMATPLSNLLLDWEELENSIMYSLAGVEIIAVFLFVRWLSKRLDDRTLIVIGSLVLTLATSWLLYVIPLAKPHSPKENLWKFIVSLVLDMFALPFLVASGISLYSKITRKETQGLSMGLRRSVVGMATILAPLWAGSAIHWPYIMFGVMLGLLVMSLIMLALSYSKLRPLSEMPVNRAGLITTTQSDDESKPLL